MVNVSRLHSRVTPCKFSLNLEPKVNDCRMLGSVTPRKLRLIAKGQCLRAARQHDTFQALGETVAKHHICRQHGSVNSCKLQSQKSPKVNVCRLHRTSNHTSSG